MKQPIIYTVQQGDSLSLISKKLYGDFSYVDEIARMNNIVNKNLIHTGQQLLVPDVPDAERVKAEVVSTDESINQTASWKVWMGKAFPWIIIVGGAVLLAHSANKQRKKNKALAK